MEELVREVLRLRLRGQCWRMGCTNPVEAGRVGCVTHDLFDAEET